MTQQSVTPGLLEKALQRASPAGTLSRLRLIAVLALLMTGLVGGASTQEPGAPRVIRLPSPGSAEWQPLHFRSIERWTDYQVRIDPAGRPAFRAAADCAASAMRLALPGDLDLDATPRLAWRWRIEKGLDPAGEKTRDGDDFAARVYVLFEFDADHAGIVARLERSLGRRLFGVDVPGKTINYVWASRAPVGEHWTSPYHDDARLVAVATDSAAAGSSAPEWRETIVDLRADARTLFNPPVHQRPYALALMVDADNRCQEAIAWFSDFRLLGPANADVMGAPHTGR